MSKMKALVKKYNKEGLWLDEVNVPELGINDVLIRIKMTSICGTDVHIYNWDDWAQKTINTPMVIGHEYVGTIEEVGSNVHDFYKGELVSGEGHIVCGHCRNCLAGRRHLCMDTKGVGVNRDGAFAEYLCIPASNVWVCDPSIPEEVLSYVVITDVNPDRLELARKMGVTRAVDVRTESLKDVMDDLNMKEGFDVGLEMSGNADALNEMLGILCHGGKVALLGIVQPGTTIDWDLIVFNGLTIKGIYGRQMFETWYKMSSMIQTGLDISPIITHQFDYKEFQTGFELMSSRKSGKVILDWTKV
jgi:threonine 3-dehydrogenase